jgi:hypothetical protein
MSTYFSIRGQVWLEPAAFAALLTLPTGSWLDCAAASSLDPLAVDDVSLKVDDDGFVQVDFHGSFRNLGRHLAVDLAHAALVGDVWGTLTETCTDGCNMLSVTTFKPGAVVLHGTSDCLSVGTLPLSRCVPDQLGAPGSPFSFDVLAPVPTNGRFTVESAHPDPYWPEDCSCGGWDDDLGRPVCSTTLLDQESSPPRPVAELAVDTSSPLLSQSAALAARLGAVTRGRPSRLDDSAFVRAFDVARRPRAAFRRDEPWLVSWVRALTADRLPPGLVTAATSRQLVEPLALALLARGVSPHLDTFEPLTSSQFVKVVEASACFSEPDLFGITAPGVKHAAATHPSLTAEVAAALASRLPDVLARNPACPVAVLLTLPGSLVAAAAPARLVSDIADVSVATTLGSDWSGDAASLADTVSAVLAHTAGGCP